MTSPSAQPDPHGSFSPENAPRVIVRAEKYFLCSSCGAQVEIPADVVGQMVLAIDRAPQTQPSQPQETTPDLPSVNQAKPAATTAVAAPSRQGTQARTSESQSRSGTQFPRPPRPKRPLQPMRATWAGKAVDGLNVPSGKQLDRALSWVSFHLKVIDRQGSEIQRLKKLLKTESTPQVPHPSPPGRAEKATQQQTHKPSAHPAEEHDQEDLDAAHGMSSGISSKASERGPP